ncbi:MAG: hypothetical protein LUB63_01320 [Oscillospiraceae bacterium]|nr:hypothetical protein [Oscillospiraceae bacterium]
MTSRELSSDAKAILREGFQKGAAEKSRKTAIRLRNMGGSIPVIADILEEDEAVVLTWLEEN